MEVYTNMAVALDLHHRRQVTNEPLQQCWRRGPAVWNFCNVAQRAIYGRALLRRCWLELLMGWRPERKGIKFFGVGFSLNEVKRRREKELAGPKTEESSVIKWKKFMKIIQKKNVELEGIKFSEKKENRRIVKFII